MKHLIPPSNQSIYNTVLLDPPWNERGGGKYKRGADHHYPIMKTPKILETVIRCPFWRNLDDDAHMYMWTTNNYLKEALWLMEALNFRYVTNIVWCKMKDGKVQNGIGQYFRGSHELCLFGIHKTGKKPTKHKTDLKNIPSAFMAPRTKHSKKPDSFYDLIESRSQGDYLELFARTTRKGWSSWGNEI